MTIQWFCGVVPSAAACVKHWLLQSLANKLDARSFNIRAGPHSDGHTSPALSAGTAAAGAHLYEQEAWVDPRAASEHFMACALQSGAEIRYSEVVTSLEVEHDPHSTEQADPTVHRPGHSGAPASSVTGE